jgi:hypothetical protein
MTRRSAGPVSDGRAVLLIAAAVLVLALPAVADAQRLPPLPPAGDTVPADTVRGDTIPRDTAAVVSPRERAMDRLRALPSTPIEVDATAVADADGDPDAEAAGVEGAEPVDPGESPDPADREPAEPTEPTPGLPGRPGVPGRPTGEPVVDVGVVPGRPAPSAMDVVRDEEEVRAILRRLTGYTVTEYRGESAVFEGEGNRLNLTGESRVAREGSAMEADSMMVYRGDVGIVCGYGNPVLSGDQGSPVESQQVCYDINRRVGMADRARTTFVQSGTWYVRGPENRVWVWNAPERPEIYGQRAEFTSCELEEPHYTFRARSLKMVQEDVVVARNVTLRFGDVPVFWLPWMVQSLKPDRRSGLLTPQFGLNDIVRNSTGYNRRISNIGFYWAANDYVSALVAGEWFSNNYTALEGSVTYAWLRQFLNGRLAVKQYWQHSDFGSGSRQLSLNTSNSWRPDERTRIQVSGDYTTSTALVRDYSFDPRELTQTVASQGSMDRTFNWGSVSLGAQRRQRITDDQIDWTLPSFNLNLRPLTLFAGDDGMGGLTWSGRGTVNRTLREVNHDLTPLARGQETLNASASHSISLGRLSLNQGLQFRDQLTGTQHDTIPGVEVNDLELSWNTGLSFQQTLWPGTTLSPNVSVQGRQVRNQRTDLFTDGDYVAEPFRISAGASLGTTLFGFWPGFGNYERIRHKISPSLNWSYSPAPQATALQDSIFQLASLRERNRIGLSFNQTFEAKVRDDGNAQASARNGASAPGAAAGTAQPDTETVDGQDGPDAAGQDAAAQEAQPLDGDPGEPRRLPQSRTVTLLSIHTNTTFDYDFVAAREQGRGFLTEEISNSIRSDLLPGLQLSMTHSLFERGEAETPGELEPRSFKPYLTRLNTSFSIDQDFWLVRMLGLGGGAEERDEAVDEEAERPDELDMDQRDPGRGSMVPRPSRGGMMGGMGGSGWRATVNYSLNRPRSELVRPGFQAQTQQTVNGSLYFRPTEHWSVNWATSYSFTTGEFDTHVLTLARDLHRWQANFDFIKSPNGNFAMQFRVHLLDNPDLKVEYDQRTDPSDRLNMAQP